MAEERITAAGTGQKPRLTETTVLYASLAGIVVGLPLLGMMGLTLLASITILLISSPFLIIFSPLLLAAGFILAASIAGFAAAGVMALAGISVFVWIFRGRRWVCFGGGIMEKLA
ncbi:oleosin 20.3 kDa-like [Tasmannia lanceolata]|uniref:oleosin 20.3 kDa-like n=1 Tax=Tasmannia lanceolata TaxID=3420 RepID=UPI004062ADF7